MISVINIGIGNFNSIMNMIKKMNLSANLTNSFEEVSNSEYIILPGVGSFDKCMIALKNLKLDKAIFRALDNNSKLLGICVGMQMLFTKSEEGNETGLNLIEGKVVKFKNNLNLPVPHMGWNTIKSYEDNKIFTNNKFERFYFAHSFYCISNSPNYVLSTTKYGVDFASSVNKKNIFGVQFHPEKSFDQGKNLIKNFLEKC